MNSNLLAPSLGIVVSARLAGLLRALRSALAGSGRAVWRALEQEGRLRAVRELDLLHAGWRFTDPARARVAREARASLVSEEVGDR
jgi:hypothetical protein